eukprot:TRINITY_DN26859_c0_g1_i1.p1 TRINITY_DN26859_c0_g1~~TRINITY_DN26859_c0_g1_i1.p1  ORF type:complete len:365 (-),score=97.01 TRINITY_DN26859_c0_g1_i1:163-1122(-)
MASGCLMLILLLFLSGVASEQTYSVGKFSGRWLDPFREVEVGVLLYYPNNATSGSTFPVVVFGPGFLQSDTFYDYVWVSLVPLGYVVAIDGTYNYDPMYDPMRSGRDLAFLLDYIRNQSLADPKFPTYGMINDKAATMGHSFGAAGCMLSTDRDIVGHEYSCDFDSVVPISPCRWQDDTEHAALNFGNHTKFLAISATTDCVCPPDLFSRHWYNISTATCRVFADIVHGAHCGFEEPNTESDVLCRVLEDFSWCPGGYKPIDYIPRDQQLWMTASYFVPWLDFALRGNAAGWTTLLAQLQQDAASKKALYEADMSQCQM